MRTVVTKAKYAALKQRDASAISHWIKQGKISRGALVGEGVRAKIWVERADADLQRSLDPAQQFAQDAPVAPSSPFPLTEQPPPGAGLRPSAPTAADDEDLRRRRKADADRAEHEAEASRRRNLVEEGKWIDAQAAAREWGRELSRLVTDVETFLFTTLARDVAERHAADWKTESVRFRDLFRQYRAGVAKSAHDQRTRLSDEGEPQLAEAAE